MKFIVPSCFHGTCVCKRKFQQDEILRFGPNTPLTLTVTVFAVLRILNLQSSAVGEEMFCVGYEQTARHNFWCGILQVLNSSYLLIQIDPFGGIALNRTSMFYLRLVEDQCGKSHFSLGVTSGIISQSKASDRCLMVTIFVWVLMFCTPGMHSTSEGAQHLLARLSSYHGKDEPAVPPEQGACWIWSVFPCRA